MKPSSKPLLTLLVQDGLVGDCNSSMGKRGQTHAEIDLSPLTLYRLLHILLIMQPFTTLAEVSCLCAIKQYRLKWLSQVNCPGNSVIFWPPAKSYDDGAAVIIVLDFHLLCN